MTEKDQQACVGALAALAWADGEVMQDEREKFEQFARTWTSLSETAVAASIADTRRLTPEILNDLARLSVEEIAELLGVGYTIIAADHTITDDELNVLKSIAIAKLSEERWPSVAAWLRSQDETNKYFDAAFEDAFQTGFVATDQR
jgi:tellurite resistance protein